MNAFEALRRDAAELHQKVLESGVDQKDPIALVEAAAKVCDLEVVWVTSDSLVLKGGLAVFDEQTSSVCCARDADPGLSALRVAHEIGHARLHSAPIACSNEDIDPSRSSEAAPVGLQKVEDYGVNERRELQANVYARELLLPRAHAKRLHCEGGLGATEIAAIRHLPVNLVRQQLLDALLLPEYVENLGKHEGAAAKPDPSQDRAAAHRDSAFQLQAGPGTGKTRTLIKRILSLIEEGVDPSSILALTFSNRAAGELADRVMQAVPSVAPRIWIGTFHAFGLDVVRRYHDKLGLSADPVLFDRSDAIEILEERLPLLPLVHYRNLWDPAIVLKDIVSAISRAKDEMVGPDKYKLLAHQMLERARDDEAKERAEKANEVATVYEIYEATLRDYKALDFGDLVMRPALLLETDPEVRATLQLRHRHILVDEYQDVNHASTRLLRALAGDGRRLWVVGDSRQSIYRFRGASAANMPAFLKHYSGAKADRLDVSYRSTPEVTALINRAAARMDASTGLLPLALTPERPTAGPKPQIRRFASPPDEIAGIAASIRDLERAGIALRGQAVLCRTNSRLNEIAAGLEARGIPILHLGSIFERPEIRDLLSLLSLATDTFGSGLVRVCAMARYNISFQDVAAALAHLREKDGPALDNLSQLAAITGLDAAARQAFDKLAEDLAGMNGKGSPWEFLTTYLLDRTRLLADLGGSSAIIDRTRGIALWQFLNFVRDRSPVSGGLLIRRLLDRVRQLVLLAEERDLRQMPDAALSMNAVRLMTVHASKGLEFEAVHIPGLTKASFPASNRGHRCPPPDGMIAGASTDSLKELELSQQSEEECLFFVALSRARRDLRVYLSKTLPNGKARTPSPFLEWFSQDLIGDGPAQTLDGGQPLVSGLVPLTKPLQNVEGSELGLFEKCPRRFFYTRVLKLGGAKKPTAFVRAHDCVYKFIAWLSNARVDAAADLTKATAEFEQIWGAHGPTQHAYAADYKRLADQLASALVRLGAGQRFKKAEPIGIDLANGRILVKPDEISEAPDGTVVLRRVRTGQRRTDEYDRLEYTLYQLAAVALGPNCRVEALHLADQTVERVTVTGAKLAHRRSKSDAMLREITAGRFEAKPEPFVCARCPHFFICPATPSGALNP